MHIGKCSVIIPAHQEESTIKNCCLRFAEHVSVSEVIVVANACNDMTSQEAQKISNLKRKPVFAANSPSDLRRVFVPKNWCQGS
jgi:glycosyltransferase involved in cell wall biosynthesis